MPAQRSLRVTAISNITPTVRRFEFEPVDGGPYEFVPGQFLMIHFEHEGESLKRSYSLASRAALGERPAIAVAPVDGGRCTEFLWGLSVGDEIEASGPYGRFIVRSGDEPKRFVFLGTGTGIAPYRAMLDQLDSSDAEIHVALGVRTRDEALFADDFRTFAESDKRHFHLCVSREDSQEADERRCYVTQLINVLDVSPEHDLVFLCGNPNMVDDGVSALKEREFSPRKIRREKYI